MRHAALGDNGSTCGSQPLGRDPQGLLHHLERQSGQQGRDDADTLDGVGRDPQRAAAHSGHRRVAQLRLDPEWNELDGRNHLPFDHRLVGGKRRKGNGFIDAVDAVDRGTVHHQHAGPGREQIGAAGKGALDIDAIAGDRLRDAGRRHIFRDVAVFQPDHDDLLDAGLAQRLHLGGTDRGALLEHQRSLTQGVNGDAADRVRRAGGTEFHAAFSLGNRNCAVISAMMETAISDGETAPIGRPIGA